MFGDSPKEDFSSSNRKNPTARCPAPLTRREAAPWDTRRCQHQAWKALLLSLNETPPGLLHCTREMIVKKHVGEVR